MVKFVEDFAASMAFENGLPFDTAKALVNWLQGEGVLDFDILAETYPEQAVGATLAANDA